MAACRYFEDGLLASLGADFGVMPSLYEPSGLVREEFFAAGTLGLQEACVSLEPWRMAIAGDFLSEAHAGSPAEAAALSGMDAAERVAAWFAEQDGGQERR